MRISVTRTGGFGGLTRRATLETAGRPDADELAALAREAVAHGRGERPIGVPDGFHYEIEADGDVGYCADPRLTEAQSELISLVLKEGS
ncbi:protealysin inhibitor emfourin [Streptomyces sp. ODS28]|uniref:protealysin inhibitor emfourin n=1 Tax=Streptomyces sp. ODS28 TaxID=3136688 RepID=UPI0031ECF4C7